MFVATDSHLGIADAILSMSSRLPGVKIEQLTKLSERGATAMVPAGEPAAQTPAASKTLRTLDPDEIKLLVKQGEQFAAAGDLVSARLLLQRAAQANLADLAKEER